MNNTTKPTENRMGTMPINRLLVSMSLPMIASMLVQALYNIVDSIFVARLSEDALTAVSLAFPVQNMLIAISAGTCVGVNALLSRALGERKPAEANLAATNGLFLSFISYLAFALFGIFFSRSFFEAQTSDPVITEYGTQYLTICMAMSIGIFMEMMLERILQSTGRAFYSMITQGIGAIINIILDPIMIFGYFGCPAMGIRGAALATVIGQVVAACLALYFNKTRNPDVTLRLKGFRPVAGSIKNIYVVGIPSIIMMSIGSLMVFLLNKILLMFSTTAASVFGIYFKLQSFVFMPVFGLNNGMIPIIAYNYGARNKRRIMDTVKLSIVVAVSIMLAGLAIFQGLTVQLLGMFSASDEMLAIGVPALRLISLSFVFAGYCIIAGSVFQALGNGVYSLIISVARQLICILPISYLFATLFGLNAMWYAFPIAELASLALSTLLLRRIYVKKIAHLEIPC